MATDDTFSRELRSARDRIAELQRRSDGARPGPGLLPELLAELDVALEELAVTGEELRSRSDELATARRALEVERRRYRELFESAPVAYLVTDPMGRVQEANRAAAALLGVEQRFLHGKPLAAYVASGDRWALRSTLSRLDQGDEERVTDRPLRFRRRGGEVVRVAATVEPVRGPAELVTLRWVLRSLEPPEAGAGPHQALGAELAVAQDDARRRHLAALEGLDPAADLDGTLQLLMDSGVSLLGVDGVGLMLAGSGGRLCVAGGSDEGTLGFLRAQEHVVKGPCLHAYLLERPVLAADQPQDPRWPQLAEAATIHRIGAAMAVPIGLYGGPVGALLVTCARPRRGWGDGDTAAASAYASVLAALLELAAEAQRSRALSRRLQERLRRRDPAGECDTGPGPDFG
jgi:PAS domain S-box-containing protein